MFKLEIFVSLWYSAPTMKKPKLDRDTDFAKLRVPVWLELWSSFKYWMTLKYFGAKVTKEKDGCYSYAFKSPEHKMRYLAYIDNAIADLGLLHNEDMKSILKELNE